MIISRKSFAWGAALMLFMLFVSACGTTFGSNTGASSLTAGQVLQNSIKTMQRLKSAHVNVNATAAVKGASATPSATNSQISFKVAGTGDEALPNASSLQLTLNQSTHLAEITQGGKVYVQNAKGQWYVLDESALSGMTGNPFSGFNANDVNSLLALSNHTQIIDHGDQSLNGATLRHITIVLDKNGLSQLLSSDKQLSGFLGQQNLNKVLASTKAFQANVDLWIDETNFYVHRTEVKLSLSENVSTLLPLATATTSSSKIPSSVTINYDSTIDLSKFNQPVTIKPPANAIPTDNVLHVFENGYEEERP